jgi:hypothetical protein
VTDRAGFLALNNAATGELGGVSTRVAGVLFRWVGSRARFSLINSRLVSRPFGDQLAFGAFDFPIVNGRLMPCG